MVAFSMLPLPVVSMSISRSAPLSLPLLLASQAVSAPLASPFAALVVSAKQKRPIYDLAGRVAGSMADSRA